MAIFSMNASIVSRANGHSVIAAAAYRHRAALLDERTGLTADYTRASGAVLFSGIFAPSDAPAWARDRVQLWNHVERAEDAWNRKKRTAQLAREFKIALPHELTPEQNRWLLQDWIRENVTRRKYVADVAIHAPHEHGSDLNVHAHVMVSLRTIGTDGFAPTKDRSLNSPAQLRQWRASWAALANRHLERHGHQARIDHRSLDAQGIVDREPSIHLGKHAAEAERHGRPTARGDRQREIAARNAARPRTRRAILERLRDLEEMQGYAAMSRPQQEGNRMDVVDRAMNRFEGLVGGLFDLTMGRGGDGVPGSSAEQYRQPAQNPDIHIHANSITIGPQEAQQVAEQAAAAPEKEAEMKQVNELADVRVAAEQQRYAERVGQERSVQREREQERERDE